MEEKCRICGADFIPSKNSYGVCDKCRAKYDPEFKKEKEEKK